MSSKPDSTRSPNLARSEHLESLERGLRVLALFGTDGIHEFTMTDVADRLGITRASALRILGTLERLGFIHATGRNFRLGVRVLNLGYAYLSSLGFNSVAKPLVEALAQEAGETCSVGVLDGKDVVYVVRAEARRIVRLDLSVGSRLPAYLNSMGRLLLGALPDDELDAYLAELEPVAVTGRTVTDKKELRKRIVVTRRTGWCYINGEVEPRVAGLSVPLRDRDRRTIAALNITLMSHPRSRREIESSLLPRLRSAAGEIEPILHNGLAVDGSRR
jgi:IclR family pca regulon transcriptional regulator